MFDENPNLKPPKIAWCPPLPLHFHHLLRVVGSKGMDQATHSCPWKLRALVTAHLLPLNVTRTQNCTPSLNLKMTQADSNQSVTLFLLDKTHGDEGIVNGPARPTKPNQTLRRQVQDTFPFEMLPCVQPVMVSVPPKMNFTYLFSRHLGHLRTLKSRDSVSSTYPWMLKTLMERIDGLSFQLW
jgi:hypothetical protein